MPRTVTTRRATVDDAQAAVDVLRRSITELCRADHHDDPATLADWLANKTTDRFVAWLGRDDRYTVVAEVDGILAGVGMVGRDATIYLCYAHPNFVGQGVGRALVDALEAQARRWRLAELSLDGTKTAAAFYESMGYKRDGESTRGFGVTRCNSYRKFL